VRDGACTWQLLTWLHSPVVVLAWCSTGNSAGGAGDQQLANCLCILQVVIVQIWYRSPVRGGTHCITAFKPDIELETRALKHQLQLRAATVLTCVICSCNFYDGSSCAMLINESPTGLHFRQLRHVASACRLAPPVPVWSRPRLLLCSAGFPALPRCGLVSSVLQKNVSVKKCLLALCDPGRYCIHS
jgi:hypothetical protein